MFGARTKDEPPVAQALRACRSAFWSVALFSGAVNLLMLSGPLYMLQIYDRVLSSRSVSTLGGLTLFLIGAYAFQGTLDAIRNRVVVRSSRLLDLQLEQVVHRAVVLLPTVPRRDAKPAHPVRDVDQIRSFLTGTGPIAFVDLPWMPAFLFVCFLIHPWLGGAALAGAVLLVALTLLAERASQAPAKTLAQDGGARAIMADANRRNNETILAMGMVEALGRRWSEINDRYITAVERASDVVGSFGSASRILRLLLQSMMLGIGAYLVIHGELTAGAMIAASIMMARALAPIETVIANWRTFVAARQSVKRLEETLSSVKTPWVATDLPAPKQSLAVTRLTIAAPGVDRLILGGIDFSLQKGEALGVVGPSGTGKTSLARALVGVWRPLRGSVRLDGASLDQWTADARGRHIGYVSQSVELFDGTVAENIARMDASFDSGKVIKAAMAANAHDMILKLPAGYDTPIGEAGQILSGGQRQRIALARALYGDPFLIVLDEPNSNLDNVGETALLNAIRAAKERGAIVILIAHRPSIIAVCDKVLVLGDGTQQNFGPRDEVLKNLTTPPAPQAAPVAPAAAGSQKPLPSLPPAPGLKVVPKANTSGTQ
jgi:ATP-binding cassette subfamily C protein